jgi:hypothetical protein
VRTGWCAALLALAGVLVAGDIDVQVVDDPHLAKLPDRRSEQAWQALFDPNPMWVTREVAALASYHPERLPTLWTARLLYRGEPWTRRANEPSSLRRWRAADRDVKLAILRDARWRRDPAMLQGLVAFLAREDADAALAVSALAALAMSAPRDGLIAATRVADPRRQDRMPPAGLPGARMFALQLLLDAEGAAGDNVRGALEWGLLTAEGAERLAALTSLPQGAVPELVAGCLQGLAQAARAGRLDDDGTAAAVIACARLGEAVGEQAARTLAELAATAPRELACAACAALARSVTWRNAIDPGPLVARLGREGDSAVRHALLGVLLRLSPGRIAGIAGAESWGALARHRQALTDWAWRQYLK